MTAATSHQPDPFTALIESIRAVVREELAAARKAETASAEPDFLRVDAAARRAAMSESKLRTLLSQHPEFKLRHGTSIVVRWPAFKAWYAAQTQIPGDDRPRRPSPHTTARTPNRTEGR